MTTPSGPPPDPPKKPDPYIPDDWKDYIRNVGGATLGDGESPTSLVYNTSNGYHFTLQPEWKDAEKRRIVQPHITIEGTNTSVYINDFDTTPSRLQGNAAAKLQFAAVGIADPDVRLQSFCNGLVFKLQSFNACRAYDKDVAEYRKKYPWTTIVKVWTDQQNVTGDSLVVRSKLGGVIIVVPQKGSAAPCALKITELNSSIQEPKTPPTDAFSFLSENYCVIRLDGGDSYLTVAKLKANRSEGKFGKNSPERQMLQKMTWAQSILAKVDDEIITFADAKGIPGSLKDSVVIFWSGNSCLTADITIQDCRKRDDFKVKVTDLIYQEITQWVPQTEPDDAQFKAQAQEMVGKAGKNCYVVRVGSDIWVIPRQATKKREPTDEERRLGLTRYYVIGKYQPRGQDTGEVILRLGAQYWHAPQDALQEALGPDEDRGKGIVLVRDGVYLGPVKLPVNLIALDFARYQWINGLSKANTALCGEVTLITLPGQECIIVLDDDAQYRSGGSCFAATGTSGCVCFTHPASQQLAIVDPAKAAKVKVVRTLFTLGGGQGFVMANKAGLLVVCPAAPVSAVTPDTVVVEADGDLIGFASLATLAPLDMTTLIAAGHLTAEVTVSLDQTLGFCSVDRTTGSVTWYEFKGYLAAPLLATDNAAIKLLTEVTTGSGGFTAAVGTGDYAGCEMVLGPGNVLPLTPAVLLARLSSGKCVISYDHGNPAWENSVVVQLVPDFCSPCDLLVTNADGSFAGWAHSDSAEAVATVLAALVSPYTGGSHSRVWAYPFSGSSGPQESRYGEVDVIVPADAVLNEPFTATIIHMAPSLPDCLTLLAANSLYTTVSAVTGSATLCTPAADPSVAFVVPQGMPLARALAWQDAGYEADDDEPDYESDHESDDESDHESGYEADDDEADL